MLEKWWGEGGGGAWEGNLKAAPPDWLVHEEERQRDQYQPDEHLVVPEAGAGGVSRVRLGLLGSRAWALQDLRMRPECLSWVCSSAGGTVTPQARGLNSSHQLSCPGGWKAKARVLNTVKGEAACGGCLPHVLLWSSFLKGCWSDWIRTRPSDLT